MLFQRALKLLKNLRNRIAGDSKKSSQVAICICPSLKSAHHIRAQSGILISQTSSGAKSIFLPDSNCLTHLVPFLEVQSLVP